MSWKALLSFFVVTAAALIGQSTAQQGFIISPDRISINRPVLNVPRSPIATNPQDQSRVNPSRRRISGRSGPLLRNSFDSTTSGRSRCTRRQIRRGRCQPRSPTARPTTTTTPSNFTSTFRGTPENNADQPLQPVQQAGTIGEVRGQIEAFIEEDEEMIPNLLQLVFHTCMGGCDGCINLNNPANTGLRETYRTIREFWAPRSSILNFADMIVLMATEAIEVGMNKEEGPGEQNITFSAGRVTCDNPDNYTREFVFPHGDDNNDVERLEEEFGLNRKLAIALLGAHSVGRCHLENSGFAGRWDNTELTLDNHYYKSLVGTDWKSTQIRGKHQWNSTRNSNSRMMLNSDMALFKDFTINSSNRASCPSAKKCDESPDARQVREYARENELWARDFIQAFLQMVNGGLDRNL